jgi:hypothetical protein
MSPPIRPQCYVKVPGKNASQPNSIRVAPKPKSCSSKKVWNIFYNNYGFPNESDVYDHLLHNIDGGIILRKKNCPTPPINVDDPDFNHMYSEEIHGIQLQSALISPTCFPRMLVLLSRSLRDIAASFMIVALSRPFTIIIASLIRALPHRLPSKRSFTDHGKSQSW